MQYFGQRKAIGLILVTGFLTSFLSSCAPSYGFTKSLFGNPLRSEFCTGVRDFVRAPLDVKGLRRAWFLPLGAYEDGSFDFYAPMSAKPTDEASSKFYEKRAGQLTHYTTAPEFGFEFAKCLSPNHGFSRINRKLSDEQMRGSYVDDRHDRLIEIRAENQSTSILIAGVDWDGDIDEAMSFECSSECELE